MPDALSELIAELEQTQDEAAIEIAAQALAEGDASRERLERLLEHPIPAIRRAAVMALGRRRDPLARRLLEGRLEDLAPHVRRAACEALEPLAHEGSAPLLAPLLEDRLGSVRCAAALALGAFSGERVVRLLEGLLKRERSLSPRRAAVHSLARLAEAHPDLKQSVLGILTCHIPREDDPELSGQATEHVVQIARAASADTLLEALRAVPRSGRRPLSDALRQSPVPLPRQLARLAAQLTHVPPDADALAKFGADLTERGRLSVLGRAHEREEELKAILDRLQRPGPKSLVLVGPSGVGKTVIVHELARRLAAEPVLVPTVVHEATTGEVLSGTRYLGDWQTRLKRLQEAIKSPRRAIWYVPDFNRLVDAGTSEHSDESFANMLAPALERGDLTIIGESTQEALRRGLDRAPGIGKLFQQVRVEPPTSEVAAEILTRVAEDLARDHAEAGVELIVSPQAVTLARELADDYLPAQSRPGGGITILREAVNAAVQEGQDDASAWSDGLTDTHRLRRVEVGTGRVLETLSRLTGVPPQLLDDSIAMDLGQVRAFFTERVLGQEAAVEAVVDLISLVKAGLTDPSRPLGVLFFVGPTGVGKTEMAKALAEYIFGSPEHLVRIDLGEFRDPLCLRRLVGDPLAPERAARSGLLTAPVRERPFSVVLLDELEKAHQNVFDLLLPLMDEGRLIDEQGRVTDFRRTIIVMTSNLGSDLSEDVWLGFSPEAPDDEDRGEKVQRVMEEHFRPEFLNRLGKTVVFAPLTLEVMRQLTRREVRRVLARRGITRRGAIVETDDSVIGILLQEGFSARYGARPLKRRVEELLLKPLARAILRLRPEDEQAVVRLGVQGERLVSQVVLQDKDEDDDEPQATRRATARIRDPRRGRLVSIDDLEERVLELSEEVEAIEQYLEEQNLRERKAELLNATQDSQFWQERARAAMILAEIASLERTLETPGHLTKRLEQLDRLFEAARHQVGESRLLHDLLARIGDLAHEIEFTNYKLRCPSPVDRGEAYVSLRRVNDAEFPRDVIKLLVGMYERYVKSKGLGFRMIYEATSRQGGVVEAGFRVEGLCAFGLLKGEAGLHQWIARDAEQKKTKKVAFVRVSALPPAETALKPGDVNRERRSTNEPGVLLRKHRQHLVLTHQKSLVAIDGRVGGDADAEANAMLFLAARVAQAQRTSGRDPGLVRKYVLSHQPMARDLFTDSKAHLEPVLQGDLDGFILPRFVRAPRE